MESNKKERKSTWKPFYLGVTALQVLQQLSYLCAVIYFAPILNDEPGGNFKVFTTAATWKWVFPLLAMPIGLFIFYLIESLNYRGSNKASIATLVQWTGLFYGIVLAVIIGFNIAEWVNHCTASATTPYAFCYDGTSLTPQYEFVFWSLVVHWALFMIMLGIAWYVIKEDIFSFHGAYVEAQAPAAYTPMQPVYSGGTRQFN